jgi:hypothetical protein
MKTLIAAFALVTLAAGPVFAQSYIPPQPDPTFTVERPIGNVWGHWLTRTESCQPRTEITSWCAFSHSAR